MLQVLSNYSFIYFWFLSQRKLGYPLWNLPLGNEAHLVGVGGRGLRRPEGRGGRRTEKCGLSGQTSHLKGVMPMACGSGEACLVLCMLAEATRKQDNGQKEENNQMMVVVIPFPRGHTTLSWFQSLFWSFMLPDSPPSSPEKPTGLHPTLQMSDLPKVKRVTQGLGLVFWFFIQGSLQCFSQGPQAIG